MPTFVDYASASRDLRVLPSFAPPLPRAGSQSAAQETAGDRYETIVVGAGPAGLFLTLLLARYGLSDDRLLCIDSKPGTLKSGQADGLQPRTLEVLQSLGLANEVLTEGCQMWEVAFWNVPQSGVGIERTTYAPDVAVPARFPHEITIHQGRIERILATDLSRYSARGVQFGTQLVSLEIDEAGDADYPVIVEIEQSGQVEQNGGTARRTVRAKHVVGADGARSLVRKSVSISLEGESQDHIWGVVDLVIDTDFPDIRRRCAIHSKSGSVMIIPREKISTGEYLTRLYVQVDEGLSADPDAYEGKPQSNDLDQKELAKRRRAMITLEDIMQQAQSVFEPYKIKLKDGAVVDWWAAYQIGQRMSNRFLHEDKNGVPRVFIVGDACHTHSPKAGQGMNVSMMDSYNLAWKLAYHLQELTPMTNFRHVESTTVEKQTSLLHSYETERREVARQLIEFDTKFSSMFSGKMGTATGAEVAQTLTHEQFLDVFSQGSGFTSGCGIEYPESELVKRTYLIGQNGPDSAALLSGILYPGRRLINVRFIRHADGNPRNLQDGKRCMHAVEEAWLTTLNADFPSTGRFGIFVLASHDLLDRQGRSAQALDKIAEILERYPPSTVLLTVLHPLEGIRGCSWGQLPAVIRSRAEMRFHCGVQSAAPTGKESARLADDAYGILDVSKERGKVCVVRPDGYIGVVTTLDEVDLVQSYLDGLVARV